MKRRRLIQISLILLALMLFPVSTQAATAKKTVKYGKSATVSLNVGKSVKIKLSVPKVLKKKKIKWKSSNKKIATVSSSGVIKGKKAGKVKITVKVAGGKKSTKITVKVKNVATKGIKFTKQPPQKITCGEKIQLKAQVLPSTATNKTIVWSTSDKTKATVSKKGVLTALRPTEYVKITAQTADKKFSVSQTFQITANKGFLTKADLDRLNLHSIKKVMIVAHPDDETFWGGSHLIDSEYLVVCMTNGWNSRKSDFLQVMDCTNDKRIILSYPDVARTYAGGYDTDHFTVCEAAMKQDLELILGYKNWKEVVTHNPAGEYGKYHHQEVSRMVTEVFNKKLAGKSQLYYFGRYYGKNTNIPGEQIPADNMEIKNDLIQYYLPTAKGSVDAFGQMFPYENWILAKEW